jgi:hypothetical protein
MSHREEQDEEQSGIAETPPSDVGTILTGERIPLSDVVCAVSGSMYWAERIPMIGDAGAVDKYYKDELAFLPVG